MLYIGLDVGTSGCKASVVDGEGKIRGYSSRTYSTLSPAPGRVEIDARLVWRAVRATLADVAREDIAALAVASFGEAVVPVGRDGAVLANSIYYSDVRGAEETRKITDAMDAARIMEITGMPVGPMFSANKLLWIRKHEPALFDEAKYFMQFGDFIAYMLTGERAIDYSLASRTMLFDIRENRWSSEVMAALGLPAERFSAPVQAGTIIGNIRSPLASELGLPRTLKVVAGGHDQALAALGSGAVEPGDAVDGMGSSECITAVLGREEISARMADYNFCCEPHLLKDRFITLAFNASSGTAINWFKDRFYADEARAENIYQLMEADCPKEPTDLLFLPYVGGSGTPYFDSSVGGAFVGLMLATDKGEMYKAVLEGICFEMLFNLELLERCGIAPKEVRAVGGGTQSRLLMQIKADVLGRRVETLENREVGTVALGLLCANATGEIADIGSEAKAGARVSAVYEPDDGRAQIYSKKMEQYRKLYGAIKSLW
jgi:xylulokinase